MDSVVESGTRAFLQQAHRNNWQRYLSALPAESAQSLGIQGQGLRRGERGWDLCVLTASDDNQARMVRRQLAWRREAGLLPANTDFRVIADPQGMRIGSGGATLRILGALYAHHLIPAPPTDLDAISDAGSTAPRILVIHSGGDSRRLPHCSAVGKLFARIPRVLPDGRASTIFDEFLINLSGVARSVPSGVLLVSGDVLLVFDHLQLTFSHQGVTGVSVAADANMGQRHGVYVGSTGESTVEAYIHKPSTTGLAQWHAVDKRGKVQIDTGLVWLDAATAIHFAGLLDHDAVGELCGVRGHGHENGSPLNLYGDLLLPLTASTEYDAYLADTSDGPATTQLRRIRRILWSHLRSIPFYMKSLEPAVFVHFGTSEEYWRMVSTDDELARTCEWSRDTAAWCADVEKVEAGALVLINTACERILRREPAASEDARPALILDSHLAGGFIWQGRCIVAGVQTVQPLVLPPDVVLHQLPAEQGYVTRLYGLLDDPKLPRLDGMATYCNQDWQSWLDELAEAPETLWPGVPEGQQSLWTAQLFPVCADREESLSLTLPLSRPGQVTEAWHTRWRATQRVSLAESFAAADGDHILDEVMDVEDLVAVHKAWDALLFERDVSEVATLLAPDRGDRRRRRGELMQEWLEQADSIVQLRGWTALAHALDVSEFEDRAFVHLAHLIQEDVGIRHRPDAVPKAATNAAANAAADALPGRVCVEVAARIDFGGGWTDTPPYSIEKGGTVLNTAITLNGARPIVAEASRLAEPKLFLDSRDIDQTLQPQRVGEVLDYANPADPFALLKAAVVMYGIVPANADPYQPVAELLREQGGVRLSTRTSIPRRSGLGTSSIMAGAVLASLDSLLGKKPSQGELFDQVLCLEQMLTTGGGWQDQVGGLVGGINLVSSQPGLPQRINTMAVALPEPARHELDHRLLVVYTGQQRLAKNLLRSVMGRWMARDPEMVWILQEIARLAQAMAEGLRAGDVDEFGRLLGEHWLLNRRMDPGCTNEFIDGLFDYLRPFVMGGKLAGAGGGGFAFFVAKDRDAALSVPSVLAERYSGTQVRVWPSSIADPGMTITHRG